MENEKNTKEKLQNWFNIMLNHAKQMEKPSRNGDKCNDNCMYRTEDGNKCLVGALIPDEKYSPTIEKKLPSDEPIKSLLGIECKLEIDFLCACQLAHDIAAYSSQQFKSCMLQKLSDVALEYKLTLPEEGTNS